MVWEVETPNFMERLSNDIIRLYIFTELVEEFEKEQTERVIANHVWYRQLNTQRVLVWEDIKPLSPLNCPPFKSVKKSKEEKQKRETKKFFSLPSQIVVILEMRVRLTCRERRSRQG